MHEGSALHLLDNDIAQRISLVFFSFICWSLLFLAIYSRPTSMRIKTKAEQGKIGVRTHRSELATRLVAGIHATLVSIGAASFVFFRKDSNLYVKYLLEPLTWPSFTTFNEDAIFYACVSAGFFIADFILCVVQWEEQGTEFVIHAAAGLSGCLFCLLFGEGLLYLMLLMLFEVSTPFLHFRWWLLEYGFKDSIIYIVNGLFLVFSFTIFRLVIGTSVLLRMVYELHTPPEMDRHGLPMRIIFTIAPLTMIYLNTTWGILLWKGFLKALGVVKSTSKTKHE